MGKNYYFQILSVLDRQIVLRFPDVESLYHYYNQSKLKGILAYKQKEIVIFGKEGKLSWSFKEGEIADENGKN